MDYFFFVWVGFAFALGAAVGSWLNVCIYRIPYEKSLLWPGSRCGHCFQPVRWYDNSCKRGCSGSGTPCSCRF